MPKFIKDDERLFRLLLGDLFPSLELPVSEYGGFILKFLFIFLLIDECDVNRHSAVCDRSRVSESKFAAT